MVVNKFPLLDNIRMYIKHPPQLKYAHRAFIYSSLIFLQQPFHWLELLFFKKKVDSHQLTHDPIIILGYWRSGTTYLQRLLCSDIDTACLTQYQAFFPLGASIHSKLFKPVLNIFFRLLKIKHPSHGVDLTMDFPSEEDIALISASHPYTAMWSHIYSEKADDYCERWLVLQEDTKESAFFIRTYTYLIKWLSFFNKGKQLIVKSPSHTAKIPEILKAFPNARFIYIERDPGDVFFSNMKLMENNRHQWLQEMDKAQMKEFFISNYPRVIRRYQKTKHSIPKENLIEIKFEELCNNPRLILSMIHKKFNMPQSDVSVKRMNSFLYKNHEVYRHYYTRQLPENVDKMLTDFYQRSTLQNQV